MERLRDLRVDEFTSVDPIVAKSEDHLTEIKKLITENSIRHVPIIENNKIVGLITQRDLSHYEDSLDKLRAMDIMTINPFCVNKTRLLKDVVFEMSDRKIGSSLVLEDDGSLYGVFTSIDALNAIIEYA